MCKLSFSQVTAVNWQDEFVIIDSKLLGHPCAVQPVCTGHEVERYKAWISEGTDGLVDGKSPAKSALFVKNTDANFTGSHIFLSNSIKAATVTSVCLGKAFF